MSPLRLRGLQHVSLCVEDVGASARFYSDVLGFTEIKRPSSFDFDGCWLFGYGLGIHLIQGEPVQRPSKINPRGDHLSFQADDLDAVQEQLDDIGITWVRETVFEGGVLVTQIFLHDPDHNMVEICNCGLIPVVPVQEGRSALLSKRSSIDMGQHARASVAAKLVPGAASVPAPPASHATAQVAVCGLAGCFPARPPPLSVPEGIPCCGSGAFASTAEAATAVAADCTSSGAASAAAASAALPSFTPHGFVHRSDDGTVAGSSPHLPGVRSRPSLAGAGNGNDFAGCFDIARPPLSDSSFLSPRGDKSRTWLQQQQQEQRQQNGGEDEMMGVRTAQAQAEAGISSPQPPMVSVAAGGGGERSRGGGRG